MQRSVFFYISRVSYFLFYRLLIHFTVTFHLRKKYKPPMRNKKYMWSKMKDADEITKGLWLGNIHAANDPSFFERNNVSVIINCTDDILFPSFYATKRIRAVSFPLSLIDLTNNDDLLFNHINEVERILNNEL